MYFIGQLRDKKLADEIIDQLSINCIASVLNYDEINEQYLIYVQNVEDQSKALDIYRIKMRITRPIEVDPEWITIKKLPMGFLTGIILGVAVLLFLFNLSDMFSSIQSLLLFSTVDETQLFSAIVQGEWWRIFTPIFLHFGFLHILFNAFWFKDLGNIFENILSIKFYLLTLFVLSLFSNLLQYLFMGPAFGGLSGVLYGMLGFLWVHRKLNANFLYSPPKSDMTIMAIWFFLCLLGAFGQKIANFAHAGGLSGGILLAGLYNLRRRNLSLKAFLAIFFISFGILLATIFIEGYRLNFKFYFFTKGFL